MIRNVVVGVLTDGTSLQDAVDALEALQAITIPGVSVTVNAGLDLGLRDGNASYAITADFADADAYRAYDADEEHNRIRRERLAPISASIHRVQFRLA